MDQWLKRLSLAAERVMDRMQYDVWPHWTAPLRWRARRRITQRVTDTIAREWVSGSGDFDADDLATLYRTAVGYLAMHYRALALATDTRYRMVGNEIVILRGDEAVAVRPGHGDVLDVTDEIGVAHRAAVSRNLAEETDPKVAMILRRRLVALAPYHAPQRTVRTVPAIRLRPERRREHRPVARRRVGASSRTSSADPGDPDDEPPPELTLWRHPRYSACSPSPLRVLLGVGAGI